MFLMRITAYTASYTATVWAKDLMAFVHQAFIPFRTGVSPYRQYVMTT